MQKLVAFSAAVAAAHASVVLAARVNHRGIAAEYGGTTNDDGRVRTVAAPKTTTPQQGNAATSVQTTTTTSRLTPPPRNDLERKSFLPASSTEQPPSRLKSQDGSSVETTTSASSTTEQSPHNVSTTGPGRSAVPPRKAVPTAGQAENGKATGAVELPQRRDVGRKQKGDDPFENAAQDLIAVEVGERLLEWEVVEHKKLFSDILEESDWEVVRQQKLFMGILDELGTSVAVLEEALNKCSDALPKGFAERAAALTPSASNANLQAVTKFMAEVKTLMNADFAESKISDARRNVVSYTYCLAKLMQPYNKPPILAEPDASQPASVEQEVVDRRAISAVLDSILDCPKSYKDHAALLATRVALEAHPCKNVWTIVTGRERGALCCNVAAKLIKVLQDISAELIESKRSNELVNCATGLLSGVQAIQDCLRMVSPDRGKIADGEQDVTNSKHWSKLQCNYLEHVPKLMKENPSFRVNTDKWKEVGMLSYALALALRGRQAPKNERRAHWAANRSLTVPHF